MRILLAEDDFASRKFMDKFLSRYGECEITVDGEEAVDAFMMALEDDEPYDLICLDIMMPVMDGFETARRIRKRPAVDNFVGDVIDKFFEIEFLQRYALQPVLQSGNC